MILAGLFVFGVFYFLTLFTLHKIHKRHMEVMKIRYMRQINSLTDTVKKLESLIGANGKVKEFLIELNGKERK